MQVVVNDTEQTRQRQLPLSVLKEPSLNVRPPSLWVRFKIHFSSEDSFARSLLSSINLRKTSAVTEMAKLYAVDVPHSSEIHSWRLRWKSAEKEFHSHQLSKIANLFPNIKALVTVICTLPVTSCTAERYFSGHKRVKTADWSTMTNERLSSLTLLHVHQDVPISVEQFSRRRLQL